MSDLFDLTGRVAVITGGAGFLGRRHAQVLAGAGATCVLADLDLGAAEAAASEIGGGAIGLAADITSEAAVEGLLAAVLERCGRVDVLVNNAANDPKVGGEGPVEFSRLEHFPLASWQADLAVGLTGAFLCSRVIGAELARRGGGTILNVASDLGVIAPDQRLYARPGVPADRQPAKPVSYSVVKTGLIGLTRYLATYWAEAGVRVNAISPGGVANGQPEEFVARLAERIPMGRMAEPDELAGAVLFLCSDASSYMTGHNLVIDGGRSVW